MEPGGSRGLRFETDESGPSPCPVVVVANGEVYNNDEHATGHRNHTGRIYTRVVFELWHRCHCPRTCEKCRRDL